MKIEKVNDNQLKIILNQSDLVERNIKITELSYGSEKIQDLFREMMEEAISHYGFEVDNKPLMIEAIPISLNSIMIIVTKVSSQSDLSTQLSMFQQAAEARKRSIEQSEDINASAPAKVDSNLIIYSFTNLDYVSAVASQINEFYSESNSLYKHNNQYYLIMNKPVSQAHIKKIEYTLSEFGQRHQSSTLSKYYLVEHGEVILQSEAIRSLSEVFANV